MKKWLFVALALILMPVAVLFAGCSTKDKEVVIRVNDDYVQWAYVGEDEWTNVISIEDIKNALGEGYQGEKGEQGEAGVDGRQVEFSKNETHIIWRYVGEDVWHNLVALSEIKGKDGETTISGPKHTVTFDSNGGTEIAPITNVSHLSAISKPKTPTRPGYAFDGWYSDGDMWNFNGCLVSKDITLTAKWNPLFTYTLKDGNATITGLTSFGQNLESICFASSIDGVEVKKVQISPSSNYLKSISFEEGIEDVDINVYGCQNLKFFVLPDSCKTLNDNVYYGLNPDVLTEFRNGLYLGTKSNPYFYLAQMIDPNIKEFEIHSDCKFAPSLYSAFRLEKIIFAGNMNSYKKLPHYISYCNRDMAGVVEIVCSDGMFLSNDTFLEITTSNGETTKIKPKYYSSIGGIGRVGGIISIKVSDGFTIIDNVMFQGCRDLQSIELPNSINSIGSEAFDGCSGLTSIVIPKNVTFIGERAFSGCSSLTEVHISDLAAWFNITFDINNSVFIGKSANPLYYAHHLYLNGTELTEIEIPAVITRINDYALCGASALTSITIPESVISIGSYAFSGCSGLTSITIPDGVTSIGNYAFDGCSSLETINFVGTVAEFKTKNFDFGLSQLIKVVCTDGECFDTDAYFECAYSNGEVKYFKPNNTIQNKDKVTSVRIGYGVTSIGNYAFDGCSGLTSITIPNSVTIIGDEAFRGCSGLTEVHIADLVSWLKILFGTSDSNPLCYADRLYLNGIKLTEIEIPAVITKINDYALFGAYFITSITIPNSVTSIGRYAFANCQGLTSIIIPESVISIGTTAFGACGKVFCEQGAKPLDWNANWSFGVKGVYWYRETKPTKEGNFWHYVDGEPVIW